MIFHLSKKPTAHNRKRRILAVAILNAAILLIAAGRADAIFEKFNLYGVGAGAFSLGGPVIPSSNDALGFLSNPAALRDTAASTYVFSFGSMNTEVAGVDKYSYMMAGMVKGPRSAWTVGKYKDEGYSRTLGTYSYCARTGESPFYYGLNVNGFSYKAPAGSASGFSADFGLIYAMSEKVSAGMSLKNFITTTGSEKESAANNTQRSLSQVMGFGLRYRYSKDIDLNFSYNTLKTAEKNIGPNEERKYKSMQFGVEYSLPSGISVQASGGSNDYPANETDKMAFAGLGYRMDKYSFSAAMINKNNTYDSGSAMTLAYKTSGEWNAPPPAVSKPAAAATSTVPAATPSVKFEAPLPKVKEPEIAKPQIDEPGPVVTDFALPDDDAAEPAVNEPQKTFALDVGDAAVDPKAILIPAYRRPEFTDVSGIWAEGYVKELVERGFYSTYEGDKFMPSSLATRDEFYRLVFLSQIERLFGAPIAVYFATGQPVHAVVTLESPALESPLRITSGSYKTAGDKRLLITRKQLVDRGVMPGRYRLRVRLSAEGRFEGNIEDSITILDTSFDFSELAGLTGEEREKRALEISDRLSALGIKADYLFAIRNQGEVPRIEALGAIFSSMDYDPTPAAQGQKLYNDISGLNDKERGAVYAASKARAAFGNRPLMGGYPDGSFKPNKPVTQSEAAAIIARSIGLTVEDLISNKPVILTSSGASDKPQITQRTVAAPQPPVPEKRIVAIEPLKTAAVKPRTAARIVEPRTKTGNIEKPAAVSSSRSYFLVVAKSCLFRENADETAAKLTKKNYNASVVEERIGGSNVYHVALGSFDNAQDAEAAASSVVPGYELSVKKVSLDAPALRALPAPAKIQSKPDVNEREVFMVVPTTPANKPLAPQKTDIYKMQSQ